MILGELTFRFRDNLYAIGLDWDDGPFEEGKAIVIGVVATRAPVNNPKEREELRATISVESGHDDPDLVHPGVLVVTVAEQEVFRKPLSELFGEESTIGAVLEFIPAHLFGGDPVVGCLVRSGISATVGEIVSCKNATSEEKWYRRRLSAMGRCLKAGAGSMLLKTGARALRCVARAGF
jgi:hypothetical protein